jgi:hypothetical protein
MKIFMYINWINFCIRDAILQSLDELTETAVPAKILRKGDLNLDEPVSE